MKQLEMIRTSATRWIQRCALALSTLVAIAAGAAPLSVTITKVDESTVTGNLVGLQDGRIVLTAPDAKIPLEDLVNLIPKNAASAAAAVPSPVNAAVRKLTGKVIGTEGSWQDEGNTRDKVFDGDLETAFDAPQEHGDDGWAGLDLGTPKVITLIKFAPRAGKDLYQKRMIGGKFQGSSTADFSGNIVDLYIIRDTPVAGKLTDKSVSVTTPFRYVRYLAPNQGYGNIAEAEFWGKDTTDTVSRGKPATTNVPPVKPQPNFRNDAAASATKPTSQPTGIALRTILAGDEQLTGPLLDWSEKRLRIGTPYGQGGGLDIPVEALREAWFSTPEQIKKAKALPLDPGPEDTVFVLKDAGIVAVRGIMMGIAGESLRFKFNDEERKIGLPKVIGIIFSGNNSKQDRSLRQTIQLAGGDAISGVWKRFDAASNTIALETPWGASVEIPFANIIRINSINGRLMYLTDMKPTAVEQTPYFDRMLSYQVNRSLTGGPLKLIDGEYKIGLAVHSRTVLTYDAGGQFEEFKAKVGFQQPEGKIGQAIIRVLGDGKPLYEDANARGDAAKPAEINLKISGVRQLTLEVDFGNNEDTGDRVVWANPRLLKAKK